MTSQKVVRDPEVTKYLNSLKRKANWKPIPDSYRCVEGPFDGFEIFLTVGTTLPLRINGDRGFYEGHGTALGFKATWRAA